MRRSACVAAFVLACLGCGTPPNHRLITRTSDYLKAMSFGFPTGQPFDIKELERRFPELKGVVVTAAEWIEEYERLRRDAESRGDAIYEYRIPHGAQVTLEVMGEPGLTRQYRVPPSGFVHYPFVKKVRLAGLTMDEVKERLERQLAVYVKKPEVLVHVNETSYTPNPTQPFYAQTFAGSEIVVMGLTATRFLSNIAFTGKETLVGVLGVTDFPANAEWRQIRVIRRDSKDPLRKSKVIVCDMWDYFAKADVRQDIPLAPGDVVFIPQRWSADDQFWEDWTYVKRILNDVFFVDQVRDGLKKGGTLRE